MKKFNLIAIIGLNGELGQDGGLLGNFPADMRRFRELTTGGVVIMGYGTFASIGFKPLSERINIVMTRDKTKIEPAENLYVATCLTEVCNLAHELSADGKKVFVIGGESIYKEFLTRNLVDKVFLTIIHQTFPAADRYFPEACLQDIRKNWAVMKRDYAYEGKISLEFLDYGVSSLYRQSHHS